MKTYQWFVMVVFVFLWSEVICETTKSKMNKQGLCPKSPVINATNHSDINCTTDNDCPGRLRCCNTGHGLQCVYGVKTGFCPFNDLKATDKDEDPKCASDFDCLKPAKCCDRGITKDCLPTLREKQGKCPKVSEKKENPCSSDNDCPGYLKCCSKWCELPVKVTHAVPLN